jgi:hypothetical protein
MPLDRPSGRSAPGALPALAAVCVAAGVGAGFVEGVISAWISLLFVFPALIGLAVSYAANAWVTRGRIRAPMVVALVAFVGGATGQVAVHGTEYFRFRNELAAAFASNPDVAGLTVDEFLQAEVGRSGFLAYLDLVASDGIAIGKPGRFSSAPGLRDGGVWGLWAFELVIAGIVAAGLSVARTYDPYCDRCDRWYDRKLQIATGAPEKVAWKPLVDAAESDADWAPALAKLGAPKPKAASFVSLAGCSTCREHRPVLVVDVVAGLGGDKATQKEYARVSLSPERADALVLALAERGPSAAVSSA